MRVDDSGVIDFQLVVFDLDSPCPYRSLSRSCHLCPILLLMIGIVKGGRRILVDIHWDRNGQVRVIRGVCGVKAWSE